MTYHPETAAQRGLPGPRAPNDWLYLHYEPLWRVEDRIRELLRRQRVGEKVREVYQRLGDAFGGFGLSA